MEERRFKIVLLDPAMVMALVTETGFNPQVDCVKFAEFEGIEGARPVEVHYLPNERAFGVLLEREDWEPVPLGMCVPRIVTNYRIISRTDWPEPE